MYCLKLPNKLTAEMCGELRISLVNTTTEEKPIDKVIIDCSDAERFGTVGIQFFVTLFDFLREKNIPWEFKGNVDYLTDTLDAVGIDYQTWGIK